MIRKTLLAFLGVFLIVIIVSFSVWAETQALGIQPVESKIMGNLYWAAVTDFKNGTTPLGNVSIRLVPITNTIIIFPTI